MGQTVEEKGKDKSRNTNDEKWLLGKMEKRESLRMRK